MEAGEQPGGFERDRRATARREGDEHSRRLFVADEFARQTGRVQDVPAAATLNLDEIAGPFTVRQ
jgi:hypothetical protein